MPTKPPLSTEVEVELNNLLDALSTEGYKTNGLKIVFPPSNKVRKCTYQSDYGLITLEVEK